jgi:hypothetical protein
MSHSRDLLSSGKRKGKRSPNKSSSDAEYPEDSSGDIERLIQLADSELKRIQTDVEHMRKMKEYVEGVRKIGFYSKTDRAVFEESYSYHSKRLSEKRQKIYEIITTANDLFLRKQNHMKTLYDEGVLDDTVAQTWNKNIQETAQEIDRLADLYKLLELENF